MDRLFRTIAFDRWVPAFVQASNGLSGIHRPPLEEEVAAHRGLFARVAVGVDQLCLFQRYMAVAPTVASPARLDGSMRARLASLLASDASADELFARFTELRPFETANDRCGRALWMWGRLRAGFVPAEDGEGNGPMPPSPSAHRRRSVGGDVLHA